MRSYGAVCLFVLCMSLSPQLVVAEAEVRNPAVAIRDPQITGASLSPAQRVELIAELEAALQSTRKFDVLSRDKAKLAVVREEQKLSASDFSSGNAAPTGQLDAANYLVVPTVTHYSSRRSARPVPNIDNKFFTSDSGSLALSMQVIDTASGAIRGTYSLKSGFASGESVTNSSGGGPGAGRFTGMCKEVAAQLANQLIDTVYPTTVLKVDSTGLWINRGANSGIRVGEAFSVYRPGDALVDPTTQENLGTTESLIGTAKIVRVNPKASVAQLVGKQPVSVREGDILRRN